FGISPEPRRNKIDVDRESQNAFSIRRQFQALSSPNDFSLRPFNEESGNGLIVEGDEADLMREDSDSRKVRRIDIGAEEMDSAFRTETGNDYALARTLKRPWLVWTPQLHKRKTSSELKTWVVAFFQYYLLLDDYNRYQLVELMEDATRSVMLAIQGQPSDGSLYQLVEFMEDATRSVMLSPRDCFEKLLEAMVEVMEVMKQSPRYIGNMIKVVSMKGSCDDILCCIALN
ncbi:PHO85 cyclin-1, partial [Sarracenia purpurea var. burkii]